MHTSALVLFSGGQDSATCLAWALDRFDHVETLGFDYGQRHAVELEARLRVLDRLPRLKPEWAGRLGEDHSIDIRGFGQIASSALTEERTIEMDARGLPTSFVPGRNLVFLTYAAALEARHFGDGRVTPRELANQLQGVVLKDSAAGTTWVKA